MKANVIHRMNKKSIASNIDHTLLTPNATVEEIHQLCQEAIVHGFAAVCIPPYFVKEAVKLLENHRIKVATVIGFPMGYSATPAKVEEVKRAIDEGVDEIDVVINLCAVKQGNWNYVRNDIDSMTRAAHLRGRIIKVIFEMELLNDEEIAKLCVICNETDVNFVKTSTGLNGGAATVEMVQQLKSLTKNDIRIKASAGIRTYEDAQQLIDAGASRLGTSAGTKIIST